VIENIVLPQIFLSVANLFVAQGSACAALGLYLGEESSVGGHLFKNVELFNIRKE
jgi:hypothetical protein